MNVVVRTTAFLFCFPSVPAYSINTPCLPALLSLVVPRHPNLVVLRTLDDPPVGLAVQRSRPPRTYVHYTAPDSVGEYTCYVALWVSGLALDGRIAPKVPRSAGHGHAQEVCV